ncbi:MAG: hypothetical protein MZV70_18740 [Desulfobacterales bacterium]|nr:hypothetical protein [Desulfobacterales bacterium]
MLHPRRRRPQAPEDATPSSFPSARTGRSTADPVVAALVDRALAIEEFKGKKDQEITLYQPPGMRGRTGGLQGLGKAETLDAETLRQAAGKSVKRCITDGTAAHVAGRPGSGGQPASTSPSCCGR